MKILGRTSLLVWGLRRPVEADWIAGGENLLQTNFLVYFPEDCK